MRRLFGNISFKEQCKISVLETFKVKLHPIHDGLFGAAHGWGGAKRTLLPKISHTYPTMMKLGSYTLPKIYPKNIWITWYTPWLLLTSAFSYRKSVNFVISINTDKDSVLVHNF